MSYSTLKSRLNGAIDNLPPSSLVNFINDALEDIYRDYDWGFLYKKDYLRTPELINSGTANVTKFSTSVVLNATASAEVIAITVNDIPLVERQFRVSSPAITGRSFNYQILDYDPTIESAVVLTIDPPYLDENNPSTQYEILKLYYTPPPCIVNNTPIIDFRKWEYFISKKLWRQLRLDISLDEVMRNDPAKYYASEPYCVISAPDQNDTNSYIPRFELYPAPRYERIYEVVYQRKGRKFLDDGSDDDTELPSVLTEEMVLNRARVKAYEFMVAKAQDLKISNVGRFLQLIVLADKNKQELLDKAKKADREIFPRGWITQYSALPYCDGFLNSHYGNDYFDLNGLRNTVLIDF